MQDKDLVAIVRRLRKLESRGRETKNAIDGIRAELRRELDARGADELQAGKYRVRRVSYDRMVFDTKKFREQQPVAYEAYSAPQTVSKIEVVG